MPNPLDPRPIKKSIKVSGMKIDNSSQEIPCFIVASHILDKSLKPDELPTEILGVFKTIEDAEKYMQDVEIDYVLTRYFLIPYKARIIIEEEDND